MRKFKKIIGISILTLIFTIMLTQSSHAAMQIVNGGTVKTYITASNSFAYCYNLRLSGTTLGNNTLDPHLILNSDYGALAYLTKSVYGLNKYENLYSTNNYSTTRNNSGVIWSKNNEIQTSSISTLYSGTSTSLTNLIKFKNTKYVEVLPAAFNSEENRGRYINEPYEDYLTPYYVTSSWPILIREPNLYQRATTTTNSTRGGGGIATNYSSFRPVIWN